MSRKKKLIPEDEFDRYIEEVTGNCNCNKCGFYYDENCKCQCDMTYDDYLNSIECLLYEGESTY